MTGKTRPAKKTRPPKSGKTATKKTASQDKSEESPSSNDLLRKKLEGYEKKLAKYEKALGASKRNNVTLHEAYKKARKEIKALKKAAPQADSAELEELRHPPAVVRDRVADRWTLDNIFLPAAETPTRPPWLRRRWRQLRHLVSRSGTRRAA